MQFQFRFDDGDYVIVTCEVQKAVLGSPESRTELVAASITDSKLSNRSLDGLFDFAAQVVDYFDSSASNDAPAGDWFTNQWLPATKGGL